MTSAHRTRPRLRSARAAFLVATASALNFAALSISAPVFAQDVSAAANAYSRAQKAELGGDHEAAAELYELADSLAPAPEALRSALKSRKAAGQLATAAVHAEALLRRYPDDKRSKDLGETTLEEAKSKFARYAVACKPKPCSLVVDGAATTTEADEEHVLYLEPGKHEVNAIFGTQKTEPKVAEGEAGADGSLSFDAPPEPKPIRDGSGANAGAGAGSSDFGADRGTDASGGGLPPWVFVTSTVVTVGLGAASVWSGMDVLDAHDSYKPHPSQEAYDRGKDKELRTNILIGAASAAGVATIVIAVLTDWKGKSQSAAAESPKRIAAGASVLAGGAAVTVEGSF